MRAVIQRVTSASVTFKETAATRSIERGIVVLLGVSPDDTEKDALWLASKIVDLRIFPNEAGKFDLSLRDINGSALVVSQFTLYADCRRGKRPDFTQAARPELAEILYEHFVEHLRDRTITTETGQFAADMLVSINNDGPVTIILDSTKVLS